MPRKRSIPRICQQCGTAFFALPHQVKVGKAKFCGHDCYLDSRGRGRWSGEDVWASLVIEGDCRLWPGRTQSKGYGVLPSLTDYREGDVLAHHIAWQRATGSLPPAELIVGHTCDVRRCVRHDGDGTYEVAGISYERRGHLWLGTIAANQADMAAKGRSYCGDRFKAWETRRLRAANL